MINQWKPKVCEYNSRFEFLNYCSKPLFWAEGGGGKGGIENGLWVVIENVRWVPVAVFFYGVYVPVSGPNTSY